jgi:hypothetical protein
MFCQCQSYASRSPACGTADALPSYATPAFRNEWHGTSCALIKNDSVHCMYWAGASVLATRTMLASERGVKSCSLSLSISILLVAHHLDPAPQELTPGSQADLCITNSCGMLVAGSSQCTTAPKATRVTDCLAAERVSRISHGDRCPCLTMLERGR